MKKLSSLLLALALAAGLCACGGSDGGSSSSPAPSSSPSPAPSASADPSADAADPLSLSLFEYASGLKDADTALTVDGDPVPNEVYLYWLSSYCYYISYQYSLYGMEADFTDEDLAAGLKENARDVTVYFQVLRRLCDENGVTLTDEQQADFQAQLDSVLAEEGITMEELLRQYGLSEASFRSINTAELCRDGLMDALVGEPDPADLEQYVSDAGIYSCKHILLLTVDMDGTPSLRDDGTYGYPPLDEETVARQRALAEELLARLKASEDLEADFDALMHEYSQDSGLAANPDGYLTSKGEMVPEFEEAALAVSPGQLTDIVESTYGYHIILRQAVDPTLYRDDWRDEVLETILIAETEKAQADLSDAVSSLDVAQFYQRYEEWYNAFSALTDNAVG